MPHAGLVHGTQRSASFFERRVVLRTPQLWRPGACTLNDKGKIRNVSSANFFAVATLHDEAVQVREGNETGGHQPASTFISRVQSTSMDLLDWPQVCR
jgi:hypothetical protein